MTYYPDFLDVILYRTDVRTNAFVLGNEDNPTKTSQKIHEMFYGILRGVTGSLKAPFFAPSSFRHGLEAIAKVAEVE